MQAINRKRQKFINAMIYFALNTNKNKIGKIKMSKLLFALDFEHFKVTGRPVTGLKYYAYPKGPYPKNEFEQITDKQLPAEISPYIGITPMYEEEGEERGYLFKVKSGVKPDLSIFSKREVDIMNWLAEVFYDATAGQVTHWSHSRGTPWRQVWHVENRRFEPIAYTYAIDNTSPLTKDEAEAMLREDDEFDSLFPSVKAR